MMNILVVGRDGMAGHVITRMLQKNSNYNVITTSRQEDKNNNHHYQYDVYDREKLESLISDYNPTYVINCVGLLVQHSQKHPDDAIYVNAYFPHYLDKLSQKHHFKLIHISTDCVFDGQKGKYDEHDIPNETGFYGRSKALGEIINDKNLTIRTSIIGPELKSNGTGLFHWFLSQKETVYGYSQAIWSGVTTIELAKFILKLIEQQSPITGLYHLVNNDSISKKDLLGLIKDVMKFDITILDNSQFCSDKSIICTENTCNYDVPTYEHMINEMCEWVNQERNHFDAYEHYAKI